MVSRRGRYAGRPWSPSPSATPKAGWASGVRRRQELEALVAAEPDRFFRPPFGGKGWLGVYLDVPVDWPEVAEIITEAYHLIAPKNLADRHRRLIERGDV